MSDRIYEYAIVRDWYARPEVGGPALHIDPSEAGKYNKERFAISWTVNQFDGLPRQNINLKKVLSYAIDIDGIEKEKQITIINSGPRPSAIVETRNGYHVYFDVSDAPTCAVKYREFLMDRMLDRYKADQQAMDAARLLRVPNFYHQKKIEDRFLVKLVYSSNVIYSQEQLCELLPENPLRKKRREELKHFESEVPELRTSGGDADGLFSMNQLEALKRLSGHPQLGGDRITFKPEPRGVYRVFINGERKNTWIDDQGKIGSMTGRGPTVWQWITHYGHNKEKTIKILKEVFTEYFKNET